MTTSSVQRPYIVAQGSLCQLHHAPDDGAHHRRNNSPFRSDGDNNQDNAKDEQNLKGDFLVTSMINYEAGNFFVMVTYFGPFR